MEIWLKYMTCTSGMKMCVLGSETESKSLESRSKV